MIDYKPADPEAPLVSRPVRRRARWLATAAVVLLAAAGGAAWWSGALPSFASAPAAQATSQAAAPPAIPVSVATVERRDTTLWSEFSGRVEAVGRVEVRPRAAGAILAVHFREGSLVHQGDLLFTIDPAPYAAEVQRWEAQVAAATAQLAFAFKEQGRAQQLAPTSAIPLRELDQRVNDLRAAEAALRTAQAQLAVARLNLGYTEVRAPIDGRVGRIEVTPGNLVPAGPTAPVLTTLVSVDPIYASFEADERTVARALAETGDIGSIPVAMGTLGTDGAPIGGRLQFIDNVVDAHSGTVRLRAAFANPDGKLLPGQFARMRLGQPRPAPVIAVDERAIGTDQDRRYVLVVGEDNKAAYRQVQLGGTDGELRIVTAGLQPGERIVVNGLQRIRPGAVVAPQATAMNPAARGAARAAG